MTCQHCGFDINPQHYEVQLRACPECGVWLEGLTTSAVSPFIADTATESGLEPPAAPPSPELAGPQPLASTSAPTAQAAKPVCDYKLHFSGSALEFFRIWIVNIFLTVLTLGIYNAWAKVRTRRYFYAHTHLAGHAFDYLAVPSAILKGNLLVGVGLLAYYLSQQFRPGLSVLLLIAGYVLFPWLVYKSLRFKARYSSYRGIRFVFHGTLGESYVTYLLLPLLTPFTAGLIIPYFNFRQKRYFMGNMSYGTTPNTFGAESGRFFTVYIQAFLILLVVYALAFATVLLPILRLEAGVAEDIFTPGFFVLIGLGYLALIVLGSLIQQFIYARITNYSFERSQLGSVRFKSTLRVWPLLGIRLTNLLAIVLSLGLAIPWAMVRHARYVLDNITLTAEGDLDSFRADVTQDEDALGDVAADIFDFEVGF